VASQLELFGETSSGTASFDPTFGSLDRIELGLGAWLDRAPAWVAHHGALFDELARDLPWRSESRPMYTRVVDVPRLLAHVEQHALIEQMRLALGARYGEDFVRVNAVLYRDGNDSVAFHGDTTARDMIAATVATISLGTARKFLLKPTAGGRSQAFALGGGDLVVMGGTCQRTWRHAIPKLARDVGPRIAVMFRPNWLAAQTKSVAK
jgi:alkylated DNA repair dioxygenase AlkB